MEARQACVATTVHQHQEKVYVGVIFRQGKCSRYFQRDEVLEHR